MMKGIQVLAVCVVIGFGVLRGAASGAEEDGEGVPRPEDRERELPFELPDFGLEPDEGEVLMDEVTSLIVRRGDAERLRALPSHADGLVYVSGLPTLNTEEFRRTARQFLGRPLTEDRLDELVATIKRTYLKNRRPVVDVTVVDPESEDGHLILDVFEARVARVRVAGSDWFRRGIFLSKSRFMRGDAVDSSILREDLAWMNRNPFRRVDAAFVSEGEPGEVDVVYQVEDRFPFRLYGGFENTGTPVMGEERFLAGVNWGHVLAMDQELHYEISAGRYLDRFVTHSARYVVPIPTRHELSVFGHYSDIDLEPSAFSEYLQGGGRPGQRTNGLTPGRNLQGENLEVGARYAIFLMGWDNPFLGMHLSHELVMGADFKRAETGVEYGRVEIYDPATEIIQGVGGYSGTLTDPFGRTELDARFFYSPGAFLSERNRDPVFDAAREGARSEYHYTRLSVERETGGGDNFSLVKRGVYQYGNRRLLPSEQLGAGGFSSVRGYEERAASGDGGFLLSAELRSPEVNASDLFGIGRPGTDRWQLIGFIDYGMAEIEEPRAGEREKTYLLGAGPGVRVRVADHFFLRFDYAWQLRDDAIPGDTRDHRAHAAFMLSY